MRYISLFAGIGGFDLALERLGHTCVYANDFDKYCKITYDKHFSTKLDTTSITQINGEEIPDHELLVGGFPCQSFSVAGQRGGFADTRGTLFFDICRILTAKRPAYLLLENVKGLLSHDHGRTFEVIMRTLDELGYDLQWQVLNSKNFGVPQNRERVFIVGHSRGESRPKVFPITSGTTKDLQQTGEAQGEGERIRRPYISGAIDANYHKGPGSTRQFVQRAPLKFLNRNQRNIEGDYAYTVDSLNTGGVMVGTLRTHKDGNGFRQMQSGLSPTIPARAREDGSGQPIIVQKSPEWRTEGTLREYPETSPTIRSQMGDNLPMVWEDMQIRRLTPLECERLQGFPDGWTEGVSDTQRYKQLGNAVTVNVVEAIMSHFSHLSNSS